MQTPCFVPSMNVVRDAFALVVRSHSNFVSSSFLCSDLHCPLDRVALNPAKSTHLALACGAVCFDLVIKEFKVGKESEEEEEVVGAEGETGKKTLTCSHTMDICCENVYERNHTIEHTHTHMHARARACARTLSLSHTNTRTHTVQYHTHTHTHAHAHTLTQTYTLSRTFSLTHTTTHQSTQHTHTRTHTHTQINACTHTHTRTHTHIRTRTRTHLKSGPTCAEL